MTLLQALTSHYDRMHARGEAPPYGFSRERISFAVVLSDAGEAVAVSPLPERSGDAPGPTSCEVPHAVRRTSRPVANFLWDKTAYVLGAKRDPVTRKACRAHREHHAFQALHEKLLSGADDDGLLALLRFLRAWDPGDYGALPHAEAMLGLNVIFRLDRDRHWLHERPEAKLAWAEHLARTMPAHGTCLVTGARAPIALVHPAVKGVRGTHAAGAALVTFNLDTFESYGKTQGANAPISIHAAFAYSSALNALLAFDSRRRIRIGEMTVVFWAETTADEGIASDAERLLSAAMDETPADAQAASAVARTLESAARGEPLADATPNSSRPAMTAPHPDALAANVGRLSVLAVARRAPRRALAHRIVEYRDDLQVERFGAVDGLRHGRRLKRAAVRDRSETQGRSHSARARSCLVAGHPRRWSLSPHAARRGHRARSRREGRHRRTSRDLPGVSRPRPPIGLRTGGCSSEPRPR